MEVSEATIAIEEAIASGKRFPCGVSRFGRNRKLLNNSDRQSHEPFPLAEGKKLDQEFGIVTRTWLEGLLSRPFWFTAVVI